MLSSFIDSRCGLRSLALLAGIVAALTAAAPALAAAPATVTVRVEGLSETKLPATTVTTTAAPVDRDGNPEHTCAGTSAAGALQMATAGNWSGTWSSGLGYSVESLEGEAHLFEPMAPANFFWSFWVNDKFSSVGICDAEPQNGDELLFFPSCFSESGACPPEPGPLEIAAPASANVGEPVTVTVERYDANGTPSAEAGATISGAATSVTTDAAGHATLTFSHTGEITLQASSPVSIRDEATVCVHQGNDGTCGAAGAGGAGGGVAGRSGVAGSRSVAPFAITATATGFHEGRVYTRAHAPRLLAGKVNVTSGLRDVQLRLTRMQRRAGGRHRCAYYDGSSEHFAPMRCGASHGRYFDVGREPTFSYLLPAALAPGRYVLDIRATDDAGDTTALARGSSRIVFYVSQ